MRLLIAAVLGVALAGSYAAASDGEDLGFRFDWNSGKCLNSTGQEGDNPGWLSECGFFDGKTYRFESWGPDFSGLDLAGVLIARAQLPNMKLEGTILTGAFLDLVNFNRADLRGLQANGLRGKRVFFTNAILTGSQFRGAVLSEADFDGAMLNAVDFTGADLRGASFVNAFISSNGGDDATILIGADLRGANLGTANLYDERGICRNANQAIYDSKTVFPDRIRQLIADGKEACMKFMP